MPEWLKLLLAAHNSLGFADTLQTLTGINPIYKQTRKNVQASVAAEPKGLTFSVNEKKIKDVPFAIGHEFGHIAGSGQGNPALGDALTKVDSKAYKSESFANDFSNSVQFLRNGQTDTTKLSPRQALITNVLLQQPIYRQHPINQRRFLENILAGLMTQPK